MASEKHQVPINSASKVIIDRSLSPITASFYIVIAT